MKNIAILGGGYAGLAVMRKLSKLLPASDYALKLVDASGYHAIKTRFHELVGHPNRAWMMRYPIKPLCRAAGAEFIHAWIERIDIRNRRVATTHGNIDYDILIITMGGKTACFGVRGARKHMASLQTYDTALECSRKIGALDLRDPSRTGRRVTVCGAGIEGIEVAAMIREVAGHGTCDIVVVDKSGKIMARSQCSGNQREYIKGHFDRRKISLKLASEVRQVNENALFLKSGERIPSNLVIWCSGVTRADLPGTRRKEPFRVEATLQSRDHPEVFATGDFATVEDGGAYANLFSAQRALYQADILAENIHRSEKGMAMRTGAYRPKGELIALGDFDGVGVVSGVQVQGKSAAVLKKANEAKYLVELFQQVPRSLLPGHRRGMRQSR